MRYLITILLIFVAACAYAQPTTPVYVQATVIRLDGQTIDVLDTTVVDDHTHIPSSGALIKAITGLIDSVSYSNDSLKFYHIYNGQVDAFPVATTWLKPSLESSDVEITTGNTLRFKETGLVNEFTLRFTEDAFIPEQENLINRTGMVVFDEVGLGVNRNAYYGPGVINMFDSPNTLDITPAAFDGPNLTHAQLGNIYIDANADTSSTIGYVLAHAPDGQFRPIDPNTLVAGDNLGNHTMTQNLLTGGFDITDGTTSIDFSGANNIVFNANGIEVAEAADDGFLVVHDLFVDNSLSAQVITGLDVTTVDVGALGVSASFFDQSVGSTTVIALTDEATVSRNSGGVTQELEIGPAGNYFKRAGANVMGVNLNATEIKLGTSILDADQTLNAGTDSYVLTYSNGTGLSSYQAIPNQISGTQYSIPYFNTTSSLAASPLTWDGTTHTMSITDGTYFNYVEHTADQVNWAVLDIGSGDESTFNITPIAVAIGAPERMLFNTDSMRISYPGGMNQFKVQNYEWYIGQDTTGLDGYVSTFNSSTGKIELTDPGMLAVMGDNLGNHIMTQNLQTGGFWLSNDGGNEGVYITTSGGVGVNKVPANGFELDVQGDIRASGLISIDGGIGSSATFRFGSANLGLYVPAVNNIGFMTDGVLRGVWDENGNLGIGTSNPVEKVDVVGNVRSNRFYGGVSGDASNPVFVRSSDLNTGIYFPTADNIAISTGGTLAATFEADQEVRFHDNVKVDGALLIGSATTSDTELGLGLTREYTHTSGNYNGGKIAITIDPSGASTAGYNALYALVYNDGLPGATGSTAPTAFKMVNQLTANATGTHAIYGMRVNSQNLSALVDAATTITTIESNLQAIEGLITNAYNIRVIGSSATIGNITNLYQIRVDKGYAANVYGLYIDDQEGATQGYGIYQNGVNDINYFRGDIGIGQNATPPDNLVNIIGTDSGDGIHLETSLNGSDIDIATTTSGTYISMENTSGTETALIRSYNSGGIQALFAAGKVKIGNITHPYSIDTTGMNGYVYTLNTITDEMEFTNPTSLGDNLGNHTMTQVLNTGGFAISGDGDDEGIYIDSDGDVGINITPLYDFDVQGNIRATSGIRANEYFSTSIGSASNPVYSYASDKNTGAYFPGADQYAITTGGVLAATFEADQDLTLAANLNLPATTSTTGVITLNNSRFIHAYDPPNNGTVDPVGENFFAGKNAGNFTMGGATAVSVLNGSRNTGVGESALSSLNLGSKNTAVGTGAGSNITDGTDNTALGYQALTANTIGVRNMAIGYRSLYGVIESDDNTAVGYFSGGGINGAGASRNTFIGFQSGAYVTDGVTPATNLSNGVYIGYNTEASSTSAANEIVIGHSVEGMGTNTIQLGNTLIDSVGFGTHIFDISATPSHGQVFAYNATTDHLELVDLAGSGFGDNLGNHTATQNIQLNGNWLSNDGGNEGVYVDADGKVGIGVTPTSGTELQVESSNGDTDFWVFGGNSDGDFASLFFGEGINSDEYGGLRRYSNADTNPNGRAGVLTLFSRNQPLAITTNSTFSDPTLSSIYITPTGEVGVATSTPSYTLDVNGTAAATTLRTTANGSAASPSLLINDTNTGIFTASGGDAVGFSSGGTEIFRYDSGGISIAAGEPNAELEINKITGSGTDLWVISETGNGNYANLVFGEGTTTGKYGGIGRYSAATTPGTIDPNVISFYGRGIPLMLNTSTTQTDEATSSIYITTTGTTTAGNVGIHTNTPSFPLDVNADTIRLGNHKFDLSTVPSNGQTWVWNNATEHWEPGSAGGGATNLTFSGASSPVQLLSDTGTDVTFTAGTGISLSQTGNNLTIASTVSNTNIYTTNGTLSGNRTANMNGNDLYWLTGNGTFYITDAGFSNLSSWSDGGYYMGYNAGSAFSTVTGGIASDEGFWQHQASGATSGSDIENTMDPTDGELGFSVEVNVNGTDADDVNFYVGEWTDGTSDLTGIMLSNTGGLNPKLNSAYLYMHYNVLDTTLNLFDSGLIFSYDQVPSTTSGVISYLEWEGDGTSANPVMSTKSKAFMRVSGGSTSFTNGVPERIDNDTPGTTTDVSSTADWTVTGSSMTYTGTETRDFKITATLSCSTASAAEMRYYIAEEGTIIAASERRTSHASASLNRSVTLMWIVSAATNDTYEIFVDAIASETVTLGNLQVSVEPW